MNTKEVLILDLNDLIKNFELQTKQKFRVKWDNRYVHIGIYLTKFRTAATPAPSVVVS